MLHRSEAWAPSSCAAEAQALVKVRGDGLEFDMGRAEMQILPAPGAGATSARLKIDGAEQPRWVWGAVALADAGETEGCTIADMLESNHRTSGGG